MIKDPYIYKGRDVLEVAKELNMEIDDFLNDLHDAGFYHCSLCGTIVDVEVLDDKLEGLCDSCKREATKEFTKTTFGFVTQTFTRNEYGVPVCTEQSFICGSYIDFENMNGDTIDEQCDADQPFNMTVGD